MSIRLSGRTRQQCQTLSNQAEQTLILGKANMIRNTLFIGLLIVLLVGCDTPGKLNGSSGQKVIYTTKIPIPD